MRASVTVVLVAMVALGVAVAPTAAAGPLRGLAPSVDYCTTCLAVVDEIESKGTDYACKYLGFDAPPLSTFCDFLVDKLGDFILKELTHGVNGTVICRDIGMCSYHGCQCGECTAPVYDKRCLGMPHKCPAATPVDAMTKVPEEFPAPVEVASDAGDAASPDIFCFDKPCESSFTGCCLTCF